MKKLEKMTDKELDFEKSMRIVKWQISHVQCEAEMEMVREVNTEQVKRLFERLRKYRDCVKKNKTKRGKNVN